MGEYNFPGFRPPLNSILESRPGSKGLYHGGEDIPARPGTQVYAEYGGTVFRSGPIKGYGMAIVIESVAPDGTTFFQLYGHLGPGPLPERGAPIVAGKPIPGAVVGEADFVRKSGANPNFSGPHLHRDHFRSGEAQPDRKLWNSIKRPYAQSNSEHF